MVWAAGDTELAREASQILEREAFHVLIVESIQDAMARIRARQPYLVLVDAAMLLPGESPAFLEDLKANPYTNTLPAVVVSGRPVEEEIQLAAFRQGADDYVVRPDLPELFQARLGAVARRYSPPSETADELTADNLRMDLRSRKVTVGGAPVALTRKEFDLLNTLLRKRGLVVYTTHLYHSVWGYGDSAPVDSHTVKVHISSLRSKLGPELGRKIVNLPGLGYRFDH